MRCHCEYTSSIHDGRCTNDTDKYYVRRGAVIPLCSNCVMSDDTFFQEVMTPSEQNILQQIMQILGPRAVCECAGCNWETNEVLSLIRSHGIEYIPRRSPSKPPHEPEVERQGNNIVPFKSQEHS
jgi:hypothetical protein